MKQKIDELNSQLQSQVTVSGEADKQPEAQDSDVVDLNRYTIAKIFAARILAHSQVTLQFLDIVVSPGNLDDDNVLKLVGENIELAAS